MVKWKGLIFIAFLLTFFFVTFFRQRSIDRSISVVKSSTNNHFVHLTLVFIHIQKTAGSQFERSIVRRLNFDGDKSCRCPSRRTRRKLRCNCTKTISDGQPWLISRFSVGWLCGVHADWTTYHRCLPTQLDLQFGFRRRRYVRKRQKQIDRSIFSSRCFFEFRTNSSIRRLRTDVDQMSFYS